MSKFEKGISGNPGGRPRGAKNKTTLNLREQINNFLQANWDDVQETFESLEPKEKLIFLEKLLKYSIPQMSAVSATIDYNNLSDSDLDAILEKITEKI